MATADIDTQTMKTVTFYTQTMKTPDFNHDSSQIP